MSRVIDCIGCFGTCAFLQDTRTVYKHYRNIYIESYSCSNCYMDFDINTDRCEEDLGASSFDSVDESVLDFMESQPQREVVNLYKYYSTGIGFKTSSSWSQYSVTSNRLKVTAAVKDIKSKKLSSWCSKTCDIVEINLELS